MTNAEFRFLQPIVPDPAGLIDPTSLPEPLPYGLAPRHILRTVEDVQDLIHQLNSVLQQSSHEPLEDLLDRAAFSGLISRTVAARLAESRPGSLVVNRYHNGYPDLIPKGQYPGDAIQRGIGLEVKASRSEGSWQSHGPRPGWFVVVQFAIDESEAVARLQRLPTVVQAVMMARLTEADWSWTPARANRIRSGTASVKPSGKLKLRRGAVWVAPSFRERHDYLRQSLVASEFRRDLSPRVLELLDTANEVLNAALIRDQIELPSELDEAKALAAVKSVLAKLRQEGRVESSGNRGFYRRSRS